MSLGLQPYFYSVCLASHSVYNKRLPAVWHMMDFHWRKATVLDERPQACREQAMCWNAARKHFISIAACGEGLPDFGTRFYSKAFLGMKYWLEARTDNKGQRAVQGLGSNWEYSDVSLKPSLMAVFALYKTHSHACLEVSFLDLSGIYFA